MEKNKLIQDMPYHEYAAVNALNATMLKQLHKSTAHLKAFMDKKVQVEDSEALLFGSAFHAALLEPIRFKEFMKVHPKVDKRTKEGKQIATDFEASLLPNDIVVKQDWLDQITGMLNSLHSHPIVAPLLANGSREVCAFWDDPETGVQCKARWDFISESGIPIDIKTTRDASPEKATREILSEDRLYWLQAAHYASGAIDTKVCSGEAFTFIFIEKEPPYAISIKIFEGMELNAAIKHRNKLVRKYRKALETGTWEGYGSDPGLVVSDYFVQKYGGDE